MARIVYGVSGEGSGHSSRASEVIGHLKQAGHEVRAVSYDRGYRNLQGVCEVHEAAGLHIVSEDNRVRPWQTVLHNLRKSPEFVESARAVQRDLFDAFQPDCVFTDFEPITAHLAWWTGTPLVSIDNQHRMRYMEHPIPKGMHRDAFTTRFIIRRMVPRPRVALITTFYFGRLTSPRAAAFPPILRRTILDTKPTDGDHILVYLSFGFETFMAHLPAFPRERFVVYGYDKQATEGNVEYRPFSRETFLRDMASAKAIITTAGFTTITESLYFRKPILALPMAHQFEQELNGLLLNSLGYGMSEREPDADTVRQFLERLPDYREKLRDYPAADNSALFARIDDLLADNCALLKAKI
jgi:uncharacterized protein (TIGR00661 family)